jgi:RNA polymerase sigma-70 factor (ECF subfamily)
LLAAAFKLAAEPYDYGCADIEALRRCGFSEEQIAEAAVIASLASFLNTIQSGLGAKPDFPKSAKRVHLFEDDRRPTEQVRPEDPDAALVARVKAGDLDGFEDLMNRHSRRIYRALIGILGSPEDARDAMQDTFFKAFQHLSEFQGRSKFSTWLVSIASNTGLQLLRDRKRLHSLDDDRFESGEDFRPKELRSWADDPEQLYAKTEVRALVEDTVMKLPAKYRVVLLLRDIEQLPIEEAAAALGLGMPAIKARLLRGRLMLREALSSRFVMSAKGGAA